MACIFDSLYFDNALMFKFSIFKFLSLPKFMIKKNISFKIFVKKRKTKNQVNLDWLSWANSTRSWGLGLFL